MVRLVVLGMSALALASTVLVFVRADDLHPATPKKPVTDTYHGVEVIDPYRWLEKGNDRAVKKWSIEQNKYARHYLDNLPTVTALRQRLTELNSASLAGLFRPRLPRRQTVRPQDAAAEESAVPHHPDVGRRARTARAIVVDPNKLDAKGTTAIDFYVPSLDGKLRGRVALAGRQRGGRRPHLRVGHRQGAGRRDAARQRRHRRRQRGLERRRHRLLLHPLSARRRAARRRTSISTSRSISTSSARRPSKDTYELGKDFPRIAEIELRHVAKTASMSWPTCRTATAASSPITCSARPANGCRSRSFDGQDHAARRSAAIDAALSAFAQRRAARQDPALPLATPTLADAKTVVPEGDGAIEALRADRAAGSTSWTWSAVRRRCASSICTGKARSRCRSAGLLGRPGGAAEGRRRAVRSETYLEPPAWYRYDPATGKARKTALFQTSPADFGDCEVVREFAVSKDGTKVPLNIIRRKGTKLDGTNPTLLYGYGGYGISLSAALPASAARLARARRRLRRSRTCAAAASTAKRGTRPATSRRSRTSSTTSSPAPQYLIEAKYTSPGEAGDRGRQQRRPADGRGADAASRAVPRRGQPRRHLRHAARRAVPQRRLQRHRVRHRQGREQFQALYAYSPYHHVKDGTDYPAVLAS